MREVRKHLLVRIRRRHSAGQVTLAAPFVAVVELVQRLPQLAVQPRRLVRFVPRRAFLLLIILFFKQAIFFFLELIKDHLIFCVCFV